MDRTTFRKLKTPAWNVQLMSLDLDLAPCSSGPWLICVSRYPKRAHHQHALLPLGRQPARDCRKNHSR